MDPKTALQQIQSKLGEAAMIANAGIAYVSPAPPPPPIDVLTWWNPAPGKAVRPTFVRLLPDGRIASYYMKTASGWPMDINIADETSIRFKVTENDDPSGIGWPAKGFPTAYRYHPVGMKICPRYYDPMQGRILVSEVTELSSERHTDCSTFITGHLGPARTYLSLVKAVPFSVSLGTQDSLVAEYYYTVVARDINNVPTAFKDREEFFLTAQSGWVRWRRSERQTDGTYKVMQDNTHNTFIPDNLQVPVFPCNVIL